MLLLRLCETMAFQTAILLNLLLKSKLNTTKLKHLQLINRLHIYHSTITLLLLPCAPCISLHNLFVISTLFCSLFFVAFNICEYRGEHTQTIHMAVVYGVCQFIYCKQIHFLSADIQFLALFHQNANAARYY